MGVSLKRGMGLYMIIQYNFTFNLILILVLLFAHGVQESDSRLLPVALSRVVMHVEVRLQLFVQELAVHARGLLTSLPKILLVLSLVEPVLPPEPLAPVVALVFHPEDVLGCSLSLVLI